MSNYCDVKVFAWINHVAVIYCDHNRNQKWGTHVTGTSLISLSDIDFILYEMLHRSKCVWTVWFCWWRGTHRILQTFFTGEVGFPSLECPESPLVHTSDKQTLLHLWGNWSGKAIDQILSCCLVDIQSTQLSGTMYRHHYLKDDMFHLECQSTRWCYLPCWLSLPHLQGQAFNLTSVLQMWTQTSFTGWPAQFPP